MKQNDLDWEKIKKKYPKAFKKFIEWTDDFKEIRDLYDFFDEQKIYITIEADCSELFKTKERIVVWDWRAWGKKGGEGGGDLETRKEAEDEGFLAAFNILEYSI